LDGDATAVRGLTTSSIEWRQTENGAPSEGGVLVRHEEYWDAGAGAGITIERDCRIAPAAITCGVYGWMVHTRFFGSLHSAEAGAEKMKPGLVELVQRVLNDDLKASLSRRSWTGSRPEPRDDYVVTAAPTWTEGGGPPVRLGAWMTRWRTELGSR
jgi:hypothetical protein